MGTGTWVIAAVIPKYLSQRLYLVFGDPRVLGKLHLRFQPELGLLAAAEHVDVDSFLLVGVYLERVFAFASEYWTHNFVSFGCKFTKTFSNNRHSKEKSEK